MPSYTHSHTTKTYILQRPTRTLSVRMSTSTRFVARSTSRLDCQSTAQNASRSVVTFFAQLSRLHSFFFSSTLPIRPLLLALNMDSLAKETLLYGKNARVVVCGLTIHFFFLQLQIFGFVSNNKPRFQQPTPPKACSSCSSTPPRQRRRPSKSRRAKTTARLQNAPHHARAPPPI